MRQILPEHAKALVPSQTLEVGWAPRCMPVVSAPRFRLCPAKFLGGARLDRPELDDADEGAVRQGFGADRGEGRGIAASADGGNQMRRNTGPSVIAAAASQRASARTGDISVCIGEGGA